MKYKVKSLFVYLIIFLILIFLGFITYYKYFVDEKSPNTEKNNIINQNLNNKNNIRSINNFEDLILDNFSITNIDLKFDDENQVITIKGDINNLTNSEKEYTIISMMYNKDKYLIHSKKISIDTIIQANDTIPFFINHYYEELDVDKEKIKYYELKIKE
ncbi:MAG: hypothetical protein E7166_03945 [Firmicutes bacterium]|nr:hypothetical protein [Bacillota bacterium]